MLRSLVASTAARSTTIRTESLSFSPETTAGPIKPTCATTQVSDSGNPAGAKPPPIIALSRTTRTPFRKTMPPTKPGSRGTTPSTNKEWQITNDATRQPWLKPKETAIKLQSATVHLKHHSQAEDQDQAGDRDQAPVATGAAIEANPYQRQHRHREHLNHKHLLRRQ